MSNLLPPENVSFGQVSTQANTNPYHEWRQPDGALWCRFFHASDRYLIDVVDQCVFECSADGQNVLCELQHIDEEQAQHIYQNQIRPLVLSHLGYLVFHGSSIAAPEGAIGFIGASGQGKSTLAASFAVHDFPFLSDDGLVLLEKDGEILVAPMLDSIRLWSDSFCRVLGGSAPESDTKQTIVAQNDLPFCRHPVPLTQLYLVQPSEYLGIDQLPPGNAVVELIKFSYLLDIVAGDQVQQQFAAITRLVSNVSVAKLRLPHDFEQLDAARQLVLEAAEILPTAGDD